jgi:hypothetical protein
MIPVELYDSTISQPWYYSLPAPTVVRLTGKDRATFLHGFTTNDMKKLVPGEGKEAFLLNIKGKILGYVNVLCDADSLWLTALSAQEEKLHMHLDRYLITEDVQFELLSSKVNSTLLSGQGVEDKLAQAGLPIQIIPHHLMHVPHALPQGQILLIRRDDFVVPTFESIQITGEAPQAKFWQSIGLAELTAMNWDLFRIASGIPLYGIDISEQNLAQEVSRTARAISFNKGCYLGQEPVARIDALGHVNHKLRQLILRGANSIDVIPVGESITLSQAETGQEQVRVTSSITTADPAVILGLGYARRQVAEVGSMIPQKLPSGEVITCEMAWMNDE